MRLIDAEQYRKEFLDSRDFEPMKILDFQPTIQAIPITENATNGDMIKAMFPNMEIECLDKHLIYTNGLYKSILREKPYNDHEDNVVLIARSLGDWWNAPYKPR